VAGDGRLRPELERLARSCRARVTFLGGRSREQLVADYAAADVFALLSERESWGVVVNEATAACLPLVLTDRVGAASDLLIQGENGFVVPAGDVESARDALAALVDDATLRTAMGRRSRELVSPWTYEASAEAFERAVVSAARRS
jgi:glycosyltransferase involved in cell wall biosynthesis